MAGIVATGGTITTDGAYTVHTFTTSGNFVVTSGSGNVWYLVVAGGAGGATPLGGGEAGAGGGGAGGYRTNAAYDYAVSTGSYTVTVGGGGAAQLSGSNSVFDTITSTGGGRGGVAGRPPSTGGSGGGAGYFQAGAAGTAGQGSAGGAGYTDSATYGIGGGGGGKAAVGAAAVAGVAGKGGDGLASTISGASVNYGGGGGGGGDTRGIAPAGADGGLGGGGKGAKPAAAVSGLANTGGGGGGGAWSTLTAAGAGGSGVVIVRYLTAVTAPVADFSGTPLSGAVPLSVAFTDLSTNTPTSWAWTFGDGNVSTSQNPTNIYVAAGTYSVGLTATNAGGSDLMTKTAYVTATSSAVARSDGDEKKLRKIEERERKRREEWRKANEKRRFDIEAAWRSLTESPQPEVVSAAIDIARPALPGSGRKADIPLSTETLDLAELSIARAQQLIALWHEVQEEEQILMLM